MKRYFLIFATLFFLSSSLWGQEYRIVPNYGHIDRVTVMEIDGERNALISLGNDNSCLVTDLKHSRVINRFSFKGNLVDHTLNSQYPEISLITENEGDYTLSAYNWQSSEILFSIDLKGIPFYLEYSQSGDILMYGNYASKISMIDSKMGTILESPSLITSLLTYGYMGGSEKTFMGYNPSGLIIYYDRFTSQIKGTVNTLNDLSDIGVFQKDIQFLAARKNNSIFLIDRQSGQQSDTLSFENILSFNISPREGTLTLMYEEGGEKKVSLLSLAKGKFKRVISRTLISNEPVVMASGYERKIYLGTESGDILDMKSSGEASSLFPQKILKISELSMGDNRLITGGDRVIWEWESPFFEKENLDLNHILNLRRRKFTVPYDNMKLSSYQGSSVLWSNEKESKEDIFLINKEKEELSLFYTSLAAVEKSSGFFKSRNEKQEGLSLLTYQEDREIQFLWDKTCLINRILPAENTEFVREELYKYNHPSLETAAMVSNELLILGKNTYYGGTNSINIINIISGETLYMEDDREVITQILPIDGMGKFYTLGYKKVEGISYAHIREHSVEESSIKSIPVYSYEEEITNQSIISLSDDILSETLSERFLLLRKQDGQWLKIESETVTESPILSQSAILSHGGHLYFISDEHSLIIMNEKTMTPLVEVVIYENGQWLARSFQGDYYFHSKNARELFSVFKLK